MRFLLIISLLPMVAYGSGVAPSLQLKKFVGFAIGIGRISLEGNISEDNIVHELMHVNHSELADFFVEISGKNGVAYELVRGNHTELLEFFIEHKIIAPDFSIGGTGEPYRGSLLIRAVVKRNLSLIEKIISLKGKDKIAGIDIALRAAAGYDSSTAMEQGTEALADFEATQLTMMKLLIDGGADVNSIGKYGHAPLTQAILSYRAPRVKFLLEQGATSGDIGNTLLRTGWIYRPYVLKGYKWRGEFEREVFEIKELLADYGLAKASP